MRIDLVLTLAENVRRLMKARGDSQNTLAERAGVSQRAVGDLLTYGKGHFKNPTLKTLAGLAKAYDTPAWLLLLTDLTPDLLADADLPTVIQDYQAAPADGRRAILRVAEAEVRYAAAAGTDAARRVGG